MAPFMMMRLMRNQQLEPAELRKLQNKKLRALIKHSYEYVPYYHSLFKEAGLRPDNIRTIDDLDKIPISKKKDIIDLPLEKNVAANIDLSKCLTLRTSGSTGTPLSVYWEKKAKLISYLLNYRWQLNCGDKITNRQVVIGASWIPSHPFQKMGIFKTKRISEFADLKTQIEQIKKFDPKTMIAFPSCVMILGKEIIEKDIQGIKIHLIFTGGEKLCEYTRELAKEAFDAEIFDGYGSDEVGMISGECVEHAGSHIMSDSVLVEIIRDCERVSMKEEGEITVTNLNNYAMPFIRYNLEDIGISIGEECSCGNCFPLIRITEGRKRDIVQLPDEKMISAFAVYANLNNVQGIKQGQLIQEKIDRFIVKIVKDSKFTDATIKGIKQILKQKLGDIEIDVLVVDNIPREKSGKFKPFISKVPMKNGKMAGEIEKKLETR